MENTALTLAAMRRKALRTMLKGLLDEYVALIAQRMPPKVQAQA